MLPLPLKLEKVLDLTQSAGGAYATRLLADAGARVIWIERPAGAGRRAADPPLFRHMQRNKQSIALDPATPEGRELCQRLAAACDFVFVDQGDVAVDYELVAAARPTVMYVSLANAATPEAGLAAASGALAALFQHRISGRGQRVEVDGAEVVAALQDARPDPDPAPSGCYACKDGTVALVVRSRADLVAAATVAATPGFNTATPAGFSGPRPPEPGIEEITQAIAAWCARNTVAYAAGEMRAAGVAAQAVLSIEDLISDRTLAASGVFETVAQPELGLTRMEGIGYGFGRTPASVRFPAPTYGGDTELVLRDLLRLSDSEIDSLRRSGVIA